MPGLFFNTQEIIHIYRILKSLEHYQYLNLLKNRQLYSITLAQQYYKAQKIKKLGHVHLFA